MVIGKLNSVLTRHGKWIFGFTTLLIIIAFTSFWQYGDNIASYFTNFGRKASYGEVFGEAVTRDDVTEKANRDLIRIDLIFNTGFNNNYAISRAEAGAFQNISLLASAKRRGIDASNKEVMDFITQRPKFQDPKTGKFDKALFTKYIDDTLIPNGLTAKDLDESVREYLIQQKLLEELRDSVVVSPDEVENFYKFSNEKYYTSYAVFDKKAYIKDIKVSKKEAESFFENYTPALEDYVPGKSKVLLISFKYDAPAYTKKAAAQITDKAVKDFYDKNKNLFMDFKPGQKPKTKPFEKVKAQAKKLLADRFAKKFASEEASKFADTAYDVIGETVAKKQQQAFEALAKKANYKTVQTDWFKDDAKNVAGVFEPSLVREVVSLREVPVSNAVTGKEAAYVAFITSRVSPRPALFEEIKEKIIQKIKAQKALKKARSEARELVAKLVMMPKDKRAKAVMDCKKPKFKLLKDFSLMSPPRIRYGGSIVKLVRNLKSGEMAPSCKVADGSLVVFLNKRVMPSMKKFKKDKKMYTDMYKRQKTAVSEMAYLTWLQSKCKQFKKQ